MPSEFIPHLTAVPEAELVATPSSAPQPAVPVCRAEVSLSPGSLKALGDMADHLPSVGFFMIMLAVSVVILRIGQRYVSAFFSRKTAPDVRHGMAAPAPLLFGTRELALQVGSNVNTAYWQFLLAAFQAALEREGYVLCPYASAEVEFTHDERRRVGREVVWARMRFLSPARSAEDVEEELLQGHLNGYNITWAEACQRGAREAGWYVAERKTHDTQD